MTPACDLKHHFRGTGRYEIPVYRPIQTQAASVFGNEDVRQVTTRPAGVTTGQPVQEAQVFPPFSSLSLFLIRFVIFHFPLIRL